MQEKGMWCEKFKCYTNLIDVPEIDRTPEFNKAVEAEVVSLREWWEPCLDYYKEKLAELGYEEPEISYDLSYSQGSGASFTTDSIDKKKLLTRLFPNMQKEFTEACQSIILRYASAGVSLTADVWFETFISDCFVLSIKRDSHRYVHESSTSCLFDFEQTESLPHSVYQQLDTDEIELAETFVQEFVDKYEIESMIDNDIREQNRILTKELYEEYEGDTSDESAMERMNDEYNYCWNETEDCYELVPVETRQVKTA
jgi:hypothetical protein